MKEMTKLYLLDDAGEKCFGEGPYRLLCGIEQMGSLRLAASAEGMAYTKALKLIQSAEKAFGCALTTRSIGGKQGGGSILTPEGKELVIKYEQFKKRCHEANRSIYREIFGD